MRGINWNGHNTNEGVVFGQCIHKIHYYYTNYRPYSIMLLNEIILLDFNIVWYSDVDTPQVMFLFDYQNINEPHRGCKIGICCFSVKHSALRRENTDCLAPNQDIVSEWGDMSNHGDCFSMN